MLNFRLLSAYQYLLILALLILLFFQWHDFTSGFRLTADDVMFFDYYSQGWQRVWRDAVETAEYTGRIGQYVLIPLNAWAAAQSDSLLWRGLFVALHMALWGLFFVYCRRVFRFQSSGYLAGLSIVMLLALQPLAFEHLPPNSYPIQNTLPFALILLCRWQINRFVSIGWGRGLFWYGLLALSMLLGDFALLFASGLLFLEHLWHLGVDELERPKHRLLGVPVVPGRLMCDVLLVMVVLAVYWGFRYLHPSQYSGNLPDGIDHTSRWLQTALMHLLDATTVARIQDIHWPVVTFAHKLQAAFIAAVTGCLAVYFVVKTKLFVGPQQSRCTTWFILCGAVVALYWMLPVASTSRQQSWCLDSGVCAYLDSRMVFPLLGIMLAVALVAMRYRWLQFGAVVAMVVMAFFTSVHNQQQAAHMRSRMEAWQRAQLQACQPTQMDRSVIAEIDPQQLIIMHPSVDRRAFWQRHLQYLRRQCPEKQSMASYFVFADVPLLPSAVDWLGQGWSTPEAWGVWSSDKRASLTLPANASAVRYVDIGFQLYHGPSLKQQSVSVYLGDKELARWSFDDDPAQYVNQHRVLTLPETESTVARKLHFEFASQRDPHYAGESADPRRLAMGIKSIEFLEHPL